MGLRIIHFLLRFYPEDFRRQHLVEMREYVLLERDRVRRRGRMALTLFWCRAVLDTVRTAVRLRVVMRSERQSARPRPFSSGSGDRTFGLLRDLRFAARTLRATPVVTGVVLLSLALGIGMNTAIFSAVNAILLRPLPYDRPEQLVSITASYTSDGIDGGHFAGRDLTAMRESGAGFAAIAGVAPIRQNLTGSDVAEQVHVGWVTSNLFDLLGTSTVVGRTFRDDDPPGTAMLGFELWQRGFGGADVIGSTIHLDGHPYTVVGVVPPGFRLHHASLPDRFDVWKVPDNWWQNGDVWSYQGVEYGIVRGIGRLTSATGLDQARTSLSHVAERLRQDVPSYAEAGLEFAVEPLHASVVRDVRGTLMLLQVAVGFVLLIACANVMNIVLVRSQSRSRELALRMALGSSRRRLVQLLLMESIVLAVGGSLLGLLISVAGTRMIRAMQLPGTLRFTEWSVDTPVLMFTAGACILSTLFFGLIPALGAGRNDLHDSLLKARATDPRRRQRLSRLLVIGQMAMSVVLLIGAGLLTASLSALYRVEPGFDYRELLTFTVSMPGTRYERPVGTDLFLRRLEERVRSLPGVESVGVVWPMPLTGRRWSDVFVAGQVDEGDRAYAGLRVVTPTIFDALGMEILDGETFGVHDPKSVVVVSAALAEQAWPGERAIGKSVSANPWGGGPSLFEVIGVASDVRFGDLRDPPEPTLYFDSKGWSWTDWEMNLAVRTAGSPELLIPAIQDELYQLDAEIPMADAESMESVVRARTASNRFALALIGSFAAVSLVLAAVGLYGVLSFAVSRRRKELGIRVALGSDRPAIMRLVFEEGLLLTGVGLALGIGGAVVLTRFLVALLYDVSRIDATTYGVVIGVLSAVCLAACYLPARRATRVDAIQILRSD